MIAKCLEDEDQQLSVDVADRLADGRDERSLRVGLSNGRCNVERHRRSAGIAEQHVDVRHRLLIEHLLSQADTRKVMTRRVNCSSSSTPTIDGTNAATSAKPVARRRRST